MRGYIYKSVKLKVKITSFVLLRVTLIDKNFLSN